MLFCLNEVRFMFKLFQKCLFTLAKLCKAVAKKMTFKSKANICSTEESDWQKIGNDLRHTILNFTK